MNQFYQAFRQQMYFLSNPRSIPLMNTHINFNLRPANKDDEPLFYRLIDRTMRDYIISTWGAWNEERVRRGSHEFIHSPNAQVIQIVDLAIGVFAVERYPTHMQIVHLYLLPEYQQIGIGKALLNSLVAEASHSQLTIRLRVMTVNPAKKFYERFGFVVTEATPDFFFMEKVF
jgi:ribosomal protein S18 acetylase RimI-like enzyme